MNNNDKTSNYYLTSPTTSFLSSPPIDMSLPASSGARSGALRKMLPNMLGAAAGGLLGHLAMEGLDSFRRNRGISNAFSKFTSEFPEIVSKDPEYASKVFETMHRTNPGLAKQPLVAAHFVNSAIEQKLNTNVRGIDINTAKLLASADSDMRPKNNMDSFTKAIMGSL